MNLKFWWDDLLLLPIWALVISSGISIVNWKGWAFVVLLAIYNQLSKARGAREA